MQRNRGVATFSALGGTSNNMGRLWWQIRAPDRKGVTFCASRRRRKMHCGHTRLCLCVCVSVCLSAAVRPHYCTDPDVTWGRDRGCPLVVHYWADLQSGHRLRCYGNNANPSYKLASIPRYDDIARTAGWAESARVARRPATGGRRGVPPKLSAAYGKRARPARRRLAAGGVLARKSERKMLASTCLYSLYAWLKTASSIMINDLQQ